MSVFFALVLMSITANASEKTPFTDVIFDAYPSVIVTHNETEYYLLSINGTRRAEVMAKCEAAYTEACSCMFAEKFTTMMSEIGYPVEENVTLGLYLMDTHEVLEVEVAATEANAEEVLINRALRNELCY